MSFLSKKCRSIVPYIAGEQPQDKKYVKVNTNENPYPPSPKVEALLSSFDAKKLRLYPDPNNRKLKQAIANKYGLTENNVFVGNGSDEVLAMCFPTFFDNDDSSSVVGFADITYSFYKVWTKMFSIKREILPLDDDYKINIADYKNSSANGFIICNPNAPTGIALGRLELIELIEECPDKLFIIDEAYADFANCSVANFVGQYKNLIVVKTFSKSYGLAGIRCGFALANEKLINGLNTIKNSINSYTVNAISEAIAIESFNDTSYLAETIDKIIVTREETADKLRELGFEVLPSSSNFLFAKHDTFNASEIYFQLKEQGVLVRHFISERIDNFVRITIGTPEETKHMLKVMKQILKK